MVPHKSPTPIPRFEYMAAKFADVASKYNAPFDLREIGEQVGYPLYMKPFDGGQWVGVTRIANADELQARYDESGERLMHLQAAVEDFDVFVRSLSIGAETMSMHFSPDAPMHERYSVQHEFLTPELGREVVTISRLVNAFFRWEFNSCETLVKGGDVHPIDYANASPDVALTSLHYYFPWAIKTLVKWSAFCVATGAADADQPEHARLLRDRRPRRPHVRGEARGVPQARRRVLPGARVRGVLRGASSRTSTRSPSSTSPRPEFDELLVDDGDLDFPAHEHEAMVARHRGLVGAWVSDQR